MKILSLFFLLFFTSLTHAQTTSKGLISNYFGTWRIVRFENASLENPSHVYVTEEKARLQIGRQLNMTSAMATLDQGLIGAAQKTCISPKYDLISTDAFLNPSEQFLLPDEHPSKRPAELRFFAGTNCLSALR